MRNDDQKTSLILSVCGILPVVWLALLTAPYVSGGLVEIIRGLPVAMGNPFEIMVCEDSVKTVLIFLLAYAMGIGVYFSTRRNYRRREEHGSAKWGNAGALNKKYRDKDPSANKLLTQRAKSSVTSAACWKTKAMRCVCLTLSICTAAIVTIPLSICGTITMYRGW